MHLVPGFKVDDGVMLARIAVTFVDRFDEHLQLTQRVLEWILRSWHEDAVYPALIYKECTIRAVRDRKVAMSVIKTLAEHGWLSKAPAGTIVRDKKRKEAWHIHRKTTNATAQV